MSTRTYSLAILLLGCSTLVPAQQPRPKIESAEQLPVHSYPVPGKASILLSDDAAFKTVSAALEKDLRSDLQNYDIQDKATLRKYYDSLLEISLLNGQYDDAIAYFRLRSAQDDKPAAKAMAGLIEQPLIDGQKAGSSQARQIFENEFQQRLATLPYDVVQNEVKEMKAGLEIISANLLTGVVEQQYDTLAAKTGAIPKDAARDIVDTRFVIAELLPHKEFVVTQLQTLIDAHKIEKQDIWAARNVVLTDDDHLTPVITGIWDVGVDPSDFPGKMWVNTKEIPDNGKDDDGNGYVDDVYGIGWTWYGKRNIGALRKLNVSQDEINTDKHYIKGFNDMQASLDTPEARELKQKIASLPKDQVRPFFEGLNLYVLYAHGTHVAGIATAGNPAARILVIRNDWPQEMIPPPPNQEWAEGIANMLRDSIRYMHDNGVRVVNMSWALSPSEIEHDMQASGSGGTAEQRHATASQYFKTVRDSFLSAMQGAPDILFVGAAGNENDNGSFEEKIPASFDLFNTMTVGAVDKGGDEAAFTSYGKVDVYSNGYEVDSVLPGGDHQNWSGTSMATPQVTNLAAKLFAKYPQLTPAQVKKLIVDGSESKQVTGRTLHLLNPRHSFELADRGSTAAAN